MAGRTVDKASGEITSLEVVDLSGSAVESVTRSELGYEFDRLRERYGLESEVALKHAVANLKGVLASVVDDEKKSIEDGGYRQTRLAS